MGAVGRPTSVAAPKPMGGGFAPAYGAHQQAQAMRPPPMSPMSPMTPMAPSPSFRPSSGPATTQQEYRAMFTPEQLQMFDEHARKFSPFGTGGFDPNLQRLQHQYGGPMYDSQGRPVWPGSGGGGGMSGGMNAFGYLTG